MLDSSISYSDLPVLTHKNRKAFLSIRVILTIALSTELALCRGRKGTGMVIACHRGAIDPRLLLELLLAEQECRRTGIQLQNPPANQVTVSASRCVLENYQSKLHTLARFMLGEEARR
jgi:hypothetical protein